MTVTYRITGVLCAAVVAAAAAAAAGPDDLWEVYRRARATDPSVARVRAQANAERGAADAARAELLPSARISGELTRNDLHLSGFAPRTVDERYTGDSVQARLSQPLFDGPAWARFRAGTSRVRARQEELADREQQLMIDVARAYFGVLRAQASLRVAQAQLRHFEKTLDQAEAFHRVGTGDVIGVQEATARRDAARSHIIQARNTVRLARKRLERHTHAPVGPLHDVTALAAEPPAPDSLEWWVEQALKNHPLLIRARQEWRAAEHGVDAAERARWPVVHADLVYQEQSGLFLPDVEQRQTTAGIRMVLPLFEGGGIPARVREAEGRAAAARYGVEQREDLVRLDTESRFLSLQDSVARFEAAQQAVESAGTALQATRKGYDVGTRSIVDLLSAVQSHTAAQAEYYRALYAHVLARLELRAAAGLITEADLQRANALLEANPDTVPAAPP